MSDSSVIGAFSAEHVARITGLTERQLAYWDRVGFFRPNYSHVADHMRPVKVYSFQDIVGLRVISVLLNEHHLSVQYLRKAAAALTHHSGTPWASLSLGVCQGEVTVFDRTANTAVGLFTGQYILVQMIDQIRQVQRAVADLSRRQPTQIGLMEQRRNIVHNARVFAGTRVTVKAVQQFLDAGYDVDAILAEYPSLQREDVAAVMAERNNPQAA